MRKETEEKILKEADKKRLSLYVRGIIGIMKKEKLSLTEAMEVSREQNKGDSSHWPYLDRAEQLLKRMLKKIKNCFEQFLKPFSSTPQFFDDVQRATLQEHSNLCSRQAL